jgi:hypothetical protein
VGVGETGDVTGEHSMVGLRTLSKVALPAVGEATFGDDVFAGLDLLETTGLSEPSSAGSSTSRDPSIILGDAEDGSGDITIDGASRFVSCSSVIECAFRSGDDERARTIYSGWVPYLENTSMLLTLRRPAPITCIDLRRGDVGKLSLPEISDELDRSVPGEGGESIGVTPLSLSRVR